MVQYTLQVTTIEILTTRMVIGIPLFSTSRVVGLITIGKAIGENLVPNRFLYPFWSMKHINLLEEGHPKVGI